MSRSAIASLASSTPRPIRRYSLRDLHQAVEVLARARRRLPIRVGHPSNWGAHARAAKFPITTPAPTTPSLPAREAATSARRVSGARSRRTSSHLAAEVAEAALDLLRVEADVDGERLADRDRQPSRSSRHRTHAADASPCLLFAAGPCDKRRRAAPAQTSIGASSSTLCSRPSAEPKPRTASTPAISYPPSPPTRDGTHELEHRTPRLLDCCSAFSASARKRQAVSISATTRFQVPGFFNVDRASQCTVFLRSAT